MPDISAQIVRVIALLDSLDHEACSLLHDAISRVIDKDLGKRLDIVYTLCDLLAVDLSSLDEPIRTMLREDIPILIDVAAARRGRDRGRENDVVP